MNDCSGFKEIFVVPGVQSHWQTDYVARSIDEGRKKVPLSSSEAERLDQLEKRYHTAPTSTGTGLADAVLAGDKGGIQAAAKKVDALPLHDRLEAACKAQARNAEDLETNVALPRLEVVIGHGADGDTLKAIKLITPVSTVIEGAVEKP